MCRPLGGVTPRVSVVVATLPFALASSVECRAATGRRVASTAYLASNELLLPIQAIGRTACTSGAPFLSQAGRGRGARRLEVGNWTLDALHPCVAGTVRGNKASA